MLSTIRNIFISLRPNVWPRILGEMLFGAALVHNAFAYLPSFLLGLLIVAPCIGGSSYLFNDSTDYDYDKSHPLRKNRPIPSGKLSISTAMLAVVCFYVISLALSLFLSLRIFILCLILIISEVLYTAKPFRFKEVAVMDILLNVTNTILRFLIGFFIVGGNAKQLPFFFLGFVAVVKLLLFLGHRWQNRKQEEEYKYKSTVVFLTKPTAKLVFFILSVSSASLYVISIFIYKLPMVTFFYPLVAAILLLPLLLSIVKGFLQTQEQNESLRNRLYIVFLLFSIAFFVTTQVSYAIYP